MNHNTGSSVDACSGPYSSESNLSNPGSPSIMDMMDESVRSTASLASSSETGFGSNGRISINPNPESQIADYRQDIQRHEQIALGIFSATMALTALPLLARGPFPVPPPARHLTIGHFNSTAAMIGRRWMKKAQTWPIDAQQRQRSPISRATDRLMAAMQRDLEAS